MKIFILLFTAFTFVCNAQKLTQNKLADSLLKIEKINFMNAESDSLNGRPDPLTESAQVIYSPDNRFKIITTIGESCGAYCNPYNMSWIYLSSKKGKLIEKALEFIDPVSAIQILSKTSARAGTDGKTYTDYLILTNNWARPRGFEAGQTWGFHQLRVQGDSIQFILPVSIDAEEKSTRFYSTDVLCTETETASLVYDGKTKTIHVSTYVYVDEEGKCRFTKRKFAYKKGVFVKLPATVQVVDAAK
jgi:hypothetical protein